MYTYAEVNTQLIQYADDTLVLTSDKSLEENKSKLVASANNLVKYIEENE